MWNYPDLNTRARLRSEFWPDREWQTFVAENTSKLLEMQSVLLMPTPFSLLR
jgi:NIPSNAP